MPKQEIEILTAIAKQTFVYDPADVKRDDRGRVQSTHRGYRIKANPLGKSLDREGDVVRGVWADKLTFASKARRNRALGRINLAEVCKDMRLHGYPEMNEAELLKWFHDEHGGSKGVTWNIYDHSGQVTDVEPVSGAPAPNPHKGAGLDTMEDAIGDEQFVQKQPDGRWYCSACKEYKLGQGIAGHRRKQDHKDNVARLKAEAA